MKGGSGTGGKWTAATDVVLIPLPTTDGWYLLEQSQRQ